MLGSKFIVVSGYNHNNSTYLSSVEQYDPFTNTWTVLASMNTPHHQQLCWEAD